MPRGVCKIKKNGWIVEDSVLVRYDDGSKLEMPAQRYVEDGYSPLLSQLPWCSSKEVSGTST
jgi:hypothetical protein